MEHSKNGNGRDIRRVHMKNLRTIVVGGIVAGCLIVPGSRTAA
jgi:hypothetical protein